MTARAPVAIRGRDTLPERLRLVRRDWRAGRHYGYPRCCIAMFCWDSLWGQPSSATRAYRQCVVHPDAFVDFVPCGIRHHCGSPLTLGKRILRIGRFWLATFAPGTGAWRSPAYERWYQTPVVPKWDPQKAVGPLERAWRELDA